MSLYYLERVHHVSLRAMEAASGLAITHPSGSDSPARARQAAAEFLNRATNFSQVGRKLASRRMEWSEVGRWFSCRHTA